VEAGFAELVDARPSLVHPLGAVPKAGPKRFRLIMDCTASGLNDCIRKSDLALPTVRDAMRAGRRGWWAGKFDLADGFFHIRVAPEFADLFGFQLPLSKRWGRYRVLVFGSRCSPFFFSGLMVEVHRMLCALRQSFTSVVYVDDWLPLGPSFEAVQGDRTFFKTNMGAMGFRLAEHKEASPEQQTEHQGHICDFANARVHVKPSRCRNIVDAIDAILEAARASPLRLAAYREVDSLVGKLVHV
jgi:hypothetical protein